MARDRNLIKEAVKDAMDVRDLAVEAAKAKLMDELAPTIKRLVESKLGEDTDRLRRAADGYGETEFEESKDLGEDLDMKDKDKGMKDESLSAMFPGLQEMEDEGDLDKMPVPEAADPMDEPVAEAADDMDEEIEISEVELQKAYESLMKVGAGLEEASVNWKPSVTGGFKDTYPNSEWETEDGPPKDTGLMDKGADGKGWEEGKPPKAQDYTVKEAIEKGLRENKELRKYVTYLESKLQDALRVVEGLQLEVKRVNLFNTKVMQVNEILNKFGRKMTNEQKKVVLTKIDEGKTVREVKMVAEGLKAALSTTVEGLAESKRNNKPNSQRVQRRGSPDPKVLRESVDNSGGDQFARMRQLAGLVK
jgi:hypothetical protein